MTFAFLKPYVRWDVIVLIALMLSLLTFEMVGVVNGKYLTITDFLKGFVPMPVRWMIWIWLGWHFIFSDLFHWVPK